MQVAFSSIRPQPAFQKPIRPAIPGFGLESAKPVERKKHPTIFSDEQPVFLLHGTSRTGEAMDLWAYFLRHDAQLDNPIYRACLPEVQASTGIEVSPFKDTLPAYLAMLRDLGEFRYQLVAQRLQGVKALADSDAAIARFFQLRLQDRAWLAPIIRKHLLKPIDEVPQGWHASYKQPLQAMIQDGNWKIRQEVQKLALSPVEQQQSLLDSELLQANAQWEGKLASKAKSIPPEEAVNPRPISLQETARLEGYLLAMEQELAKVIQASGKEPTQSQKIARKLMETIAPRVAMVAHSQGGVTTLTALLRYLQQSSTGSDLAHQDPETIDALPANAIGSALLLSAPLHGIPEFPAWTQSILKQLEKVEAYTPVKNGSFAKWAKKSVWSVKFNQPAVQEMKEDSPLIHKLSEQLPKVGDWNGTVISAFDQKDGFVEPQASHLLDLDGQHPANVFNLELQTNLIPPFSTNLKDVLYFISKQIPVVGGLFRVLAPEKLQERMRDFYVRQLIGDGSKPSIEQHGALTAQPRQAMAQIRQLLLGNEQHLLQVLDIQNDEILRREILKALLKQLQVEQTQAEMPLRDRLSNPQSTLRARIIQNAEEDLPVNNSASAVAQKILQQLKER